MKWLASSITEIVRRHVEETVQRNDAEGREIRVMLQTQPAPVVRRVTSDLADWLPAQQQMVSPHFKVAQALGQQWANSPDAAVQADFNFIKARGWYDIENRLTHYRNLHSEQDKFLLILLIGVDQVTDQSSLEDFFRIDQAVIWEQHMEGTFASWLKAWLGAKQIAYEEDQIEQINQFLSVLQAGRIIDLAGVSSFLEDLDLTMAQDGRDVLRIMGRELKSFGLPTMRNLSQITKRKILGDYVNDAIAFFGYFDFIDEAKRKKALVAVDQFAELVAQGQSDIEPDDRGSYDTAKAVIDDLRAFIGDKAEESRRRLLDANFIFIRDEILKTRKRSTKPPIDRIKKIGGSPLEVVLEAIWTTLREFKEERDYMHRLAQEDIAGITISGVRFRHDCEGADNEAIRETAKNLLQMCIGGLDELLQKDLRIVPNQNEPDQLIDVRSTLCPNTTGNEMEYTSARTSEPGLHFAVLIITKDGMKFARQFQWRFPEIHPYRNIQALYAWAYEQLAGKPPMLPVFTMPFYNELMLTRSEEDANRILLQCVRSDQCGIVDLLSAPDLPKNDPILPELSKLAREYGRFVSAVHVDGFYKGLEGVWPLLGAFRAAYEKYVNPGPGTESETGPLLFKAFFTLGSDVQSRSDRWYWEHYESSSVVTALHPSLIEMLRHQQAFLCDVFCHAVTQDIAVTRTRSFAARKWSHILDLSKVKLPLTGILADADKKLVTQIQDNGLIHLLGQPPQSEATLTTRVLLRYEGAEDDEITDADLFRESRDSVLIERILFDYSKLHPQARDGVSIAAYCGGDIQPLIAGIDAFIRSLLDLTDEDGDSAVYHLCLTVFSETSDDTDVVRWIDEWRDRWNSASANPKYDYYERCNISVAHRIITTDRNYEQLCKILGSSFEVDVVFLMNFIGAGSEGNDFTPIEPYEEMDNLRKFPILEKVCCALDKPGHRNRRERVISNRQFRLSTLHAEVMAKLKHNSPAGQNHVVMGIGDFSPWEKAVDEFHKRSAWVVCIDPCVDERLVGKCDQGKWQREIIGFGSGVGAHGEHNYTISTEFFRLADLRARIASHVGELLGPWEKGNNEKIAQAVLDESRRVSGLSLVKATGPSEYIRDYVAYALVRKLIPQEKDVVCDEIVSLDAFRHWFDDAPSLKRPDLIHLRAHVVDGRIHLAAHLIECKLARQSDAHLENAHEQLDNGLRHLVGCFRPRSRDQKQRTERRIEKPDQRYWWLQLHRLIASKSQVKPTDRAPTIAALEKLTEGYYRICWQATAITFWCDSDDSGCVPQDAWDFEFEGQALKIATVAAGRYLVRDLCAGTTRASLPDSDSPLCLAGWPNQIKGAAVAAPTQASPHEASNGASAVTEPTDVRTSQTTGKAQAPPIVLDSHRSLAKRIFLGNDAGGSRPIYWEFDHDQLSNRHLLIFGSSGMGKTYAIQGILCELGKGGQNSVIVDYTNGFEDNQLDSVVKEFLKPTQHRVQWEPVPINPFRRQISLIGGKSQPEKIVTTAERIKSVFGDVYDLGDQQKSALYSVVKAGIEGLGDQMCLERLPELLQAMIDEGGGQQQYAASVFSKIQPFVDAKPFGQEKPGSWDDWYADLISRCHILQLVGSSKDFSRLVTEFSLIDLYWYYRGSGSKDRPKVVVLDEVQNLSHKLESPLGGLLTEGRKFGFALILATQTLSNLKQDEQDRMFQAAHKLFFKPAETEVQEYASILGNSTNEKSEVWVQRLSSLKKGECYSHGPSLNQGGLLEPKCFRVKIAALVDRIKKETS